jgi:mannose-6-phosphate isomerase-like protein (cupin superfamily)
MKPVDRLLLKELLSADKDVPLPSTKRSKDAPAEAHHWSRPILMERAAYLRKLAAFSEGSASETLKEYPGHATMLSVRGRAGIAEQHERFADLFIVLDGRATLITGGTVSGAHIIAPGEIRGTAVEGGKRIELHPGDLAHVPAGVPHQMLVPGENIFTAFVVKIEEAN